MLAPLTLFALSLPSVEINEHVTSPSQIAGRWEGLVAPGEVAGFSLQIESDADKTVRLVGLDTYIRREGKTTSTWWNSEVAGAFSLQSGHLRFHQSRIANQGFDVTLDLRYDPVDIAWKGSFNDPFFSGQAVLRRPSMSGAPAPAGTWRTYSTQSPTTRAGITYNCMNIGVGQDGALVLWGEGHNISLGTRSAKQLLIGDSYGDWLNDSNAARYADVWTFTYANGLWSERITGVVSSDGSSFGGYVSDYIGSGLHEPSHPLKPFAWTRMLDLACRP